MSLQIGIVILGHKEIGANAAHHMLVKLTTGLQSFQITVKYNSIFRDLKNFRYPSANIDY